MTNFYDLVLKPTGLRITQLGILHAISTRQPAALTALAEHLGMDRTTLTRNLGPLERDGLISIHDDPADRRSRVVSLTAAGASTLQRAIPLWERAQDQFAASYGGDRAGRLRADLQALVNTDMGQPSRQPAEPGKDADHA